MIRGALLILAVAGGITLGVIAMLYGIAFIAEYGLSGECVPA